MVSRHVPILIVSAVMLVMTQSASAQSTASQMLIVNLPTKNNVTVTAPGPVTIVHDTTDNNQVFLPQPWLVKGNARNGVTVSLYTTQAFTHTVHTQFKRNARLDLTIGTTQGPGTWSIPVASDSTNYAAGDGMAVVQARSTNIGRATLNLRVTFLSGGVGSFGTYPAGDYVTTVIGSASLNP